MSDENKAVFLDRDGVINKEVNYLSDPNDFEFIEGSIEALRILKKKGYLLLIITNQSGIARGYFTDKILDKIHEKMINLLKNEGVALDGIYYCPHHPDFTGSCDCRKPNADLIFKARNQFNIDLSNSFMVGDTLNDIKTGKNANCKTVLVLTGYGKEEQKKDDQLKPDLVFQNLLDFAQKI